MEVKLCLRSQNFRSVAGLGGEVAAAVEEVVVAAAAVLFVEHYGSSPEQGAENP